MKPSNAPREPDSKDVRRPRRWIRFGITAAGIVLVLLAFVRPRDRRDATETSSSAVDESSSGYASERSTLERARSRSSSQTAEDIVAAKLSQFAENRRQVVNAMARHFGVNVPEDVERFFEVAASGNWEELQALFKVLRERRRTDPPPRNLEVLWPAIMETFGVTEESRRWPAQKLLDYGNGILDVLKPGMAYIGGTDPGRFIPTLLNETQGGERHIVVTQNALADSSYLEYLGFLYGDRCATLTKDNSDRAFADYMADAQRRLQHDNDFPDEPRQVRPGEDIKMVEGKIQASGQVSVMSINENLIRMFMEKNRDLSFAIEQSFPFKSLYDITAPLGPIMELGVRGDQATLTPERAAESVNYWRAALQEFASTSETTDSPAARLTYGKMAAEQAALLLHHQHPAQAEQTFLLATQICPGSPEAVFGYANLLVEQQRYVDVIPIAQAAAKLDGSHQSQFQSLLQELQRLARQ
jgi:hypothetical protein